MLEEFTENDRQDVRDQLGREPRGVAGVAWRCGCGKPGVIATEPRLPNGTPFRRPITSLVRVLHLSSALWSLLG